DHQPRKTKPKHAPGRRAADLFQMKTENFKDVVADRRGRLGLLFALAQHFFREKTDVDQADNAALFVDDREGEKFVEDEKFARVQDRGGGGNSKDAPEHDVAQRSLEGRG